MLEEVYAMELYLPESQDEPFQVMYSAHPFQAISPRDFINTDHWDNPVGILRVKSKEHMIIEQPAGDHEKMMFHTIILRTEHA
jgi:hypothetical protein